MRANARPYQIVLVTIDTLRADHLGCYGYRRDTSPTIDRIARDNVALDWVFSPISFTLPSHYSMMTSRYPSFHSVQFRNGECGSLEAQEPTIAEVLSRNGFATGAFIGSPVMGRDNAPPMVRGFDIYDEEMTHGESGRSGEMRRWGKDTNRAAIDWISKHKRERFFCWLHYTDVQGPYDAPHPFGDHFADEARALVPKYLDAVENGATGGIPAHQLLNARADGFGNLLSYERNYHYYAARYDGGIRYADSCIARLIEDLVHLQVYENVLLVLTSDHGEALGENDVYFSHGLTVTVDQIHVPLIFRFPERSGVTGSRLTTHSSLLDIAPTLLDFVGAQAQDTQGVSLLPLLRGDDIHRYDTRVVFSETQTQLAAMDASHQVLMGRGVPGQVQFPFYHPEAPEHTGVVAYRGDLYGAPENAFSRLGGLGGEFDSRAREARASLGARVPAVGSKVK